MNHVVRVQLADRPYEVRVAGGLLGHTGDLVRGVHAPGRCAVVTDSNVGPLYGRMVIESLASAGFSTVLVEVPAGEKSKSMEAASGVCERLISERLDRRSLLVALGGGVVGDLAGFVAAIYYRGIPYVQIPTTVVSQVDSSVGGKTGVNASGGKNLIGAFHQPSLVIADTRTLSSLPRREYNEGFAEIIKHAAIRDASMLGHLQESDELIARNVAIKAAIVTEDEFETKGLRALLNLGHTIGHGIENAAGYGRFLHGEAISLGLVAAVRLSVEKAGLSVSEASRILEALQSFDLPRTLPADLQTDAILTALRTDKKFQAGAVRFVLLRALGDAFLSEAVTAGEIARAIESLRENPDACTLD